MAIQYRNINFACLALALLCLVAFVDGNNKGEKGKRGGDGKNKGEKGKTGGWKSESPDWANKGNGEKRHGDVAGGGGQRKEPPIESSTACNNKQEGAECSWVSPRQHTIEGICKHTPDGSKLYCPPWFGSEGEGPPGHDYNKDRSDEAFKAARLNSSIDACHGKAVEEACVFRPPVWGDQEAEGFKREGGHLRQGGQGNKDWKGRGGPRKGGRTERRGVCVPMNQSDGITTTTVNFCRALPPQEATDACNVSLLSEKCSFLTNGTDTYINLQVLTGQQDQAETQGDILASFFVHGEWTDPEIFVDGGSVQGATNSKVFVLAGWPQKVTLTTWSNDAWCFWKVIVNDTVILEDPQGPSGSDAYLQETDTSTFKDSRFWIEGPPASQIFDVPEDTTIDRRLGSGSVALKIYTAASVEAATAGSVFVSFFVNDDWIEREEVFTGAVSGEVKSKLFNLRGWPVKLWIGTDSADAYSYERITINGRDVIDDPSGFGGNSQDYDPIALGSYEQVQQFWISSPPSSQTFQIPLRVGLPENNDMLRHKIWGSCQETWWDVMNGTLHCRPDQQRWNPRFSKSKHQGNRSKANAMEPYFEVKSDAESDSIQVEMIINNLDYNQLQQDPAAKSALAQKTKEVVADSAGDGVYARDVSVAFLPGSVIVSCQVSPPAYVSRHYVKHNLEADASLSHALATAATNIPAIAAMATGPISVSSPTVVVIGTSPSGGSGDEKDDLVWILVVASSALFVLAACMCVVSFCLWKKVQSKSSNPEINGTTVAVGRPVTPSDNNKASIGILVAGVKEPEMEKDITNDNNSPSPMEL